MIRMTTEAYEAHQRRVKGVRKVTADLVGGLNLAKRIKATKFTPEDMLAAEMTAAGLVFKRQWRWHPGRRFRADFGFPNHGLIVECMGRVHGVVEEKFLRDIERAQEALRLGLRLLPVSNAQVKSGEALAIVLSALSAVI